MLSTRLSFCALAATLFFGVVTGSFLANRGLSTPAHAEATQRARTDFNGSSLLEGSQHMSRVSSRVMPAVVHIQATHEADGKRVEETGSGVLMTMPNRRDVFILTNSHVIRGADYGDIHIQTANGRALNPSQVLEDRATDIAVLTVQGTDYPIAPWGDSDQVNIGNIVLAMGSPFGLSRSVTFGIISAKGRKDLKLASNPENRVINQDFLQTDAAINPGNSGGPLVDLNGRIIGINTAIASNSGGNEGIGFSIPINLVRRVAMQLLEHGRVRRAYLGVVLDPGFTSDDARQVGLKRLYGARVSGINAATPAYKAGLRLNDIVLSFNDIEIMDENHLINLVSLSDVGRQIRLIVIRNGQRLPLQVVLTERPPQRQISQKPGKASIR
ncbi:MAG: S1C family serine protease, partial [Planctomycetaceae bacterium]